MCNKIIIMRWKLFRCDLESAANSVKGVALRAPKAENACEFQLAPGDSTRVSRHACSRVICSRLTYRKTGIPYFHKSQNSAKQAKVKLRRPNQQEGTKNTKWRQFKHIVQ